MTQAERTLAAHRPEPKPEDPHVRACRCCGDIWPCPPYRYARRIEDEAFGWIGEAVYVLPDRFADRLPADDVAAIRGYTECGVWDEALDLLLATLRQLHVSVTDDERRELATLTEAMGLPRTWGMP